MFERRLALLKRFVVCLFPVLLALVVPSWAAAQVMQPMCVEGCGGGDDDPEPVAAVTPDNGPAGPYQSNTSGHTVTFTVESMDAGGKWYFYCSDEGGVTCTGLSKSVATLNANQSTTVTATFNVGTSDGAVWLEARPPVGDAGGDFGNYEVDVIPPPPVHGPPAITMLEGVGVRSRCLIVGVADYAENQCGDLVVGHGMPSLRTIGRDRALTLVYSSQQATANILVPIKVTLGSPYGSPDSVLARLRVNTSGTFVVRDSGRYASWGDPYGLQPPETRQLVLRFDGSGVTTGAYPFQLEIQSLYLNDQGHVYADTLSGTLLVVNQTASAFGRGWNLAGVERLYPNQPTGQNGILWVGGDGSAALYQSVGANKWAAPAAAYRDTISWNSTTATYTRWLKHGIRVVYDNLGRHSKTINAVGQETIFKWNATVTSQLDSIRVPPAGQPYVTYRLYYTGGKLDYIADPVGRHLNATVTNGNLVYLQDPDLVSSLFGYDGSGRMISHTSRQGTVDTYAYDVAGRLAQARLRRDSAHVDTTRYTTWDGLGLRATNGVSRAVLWDTVRTTMNGPRSDVADITRFRIGAFGAPDTIINALGQRTAIERTDPRFPALVTKVTYPTLWAVRQAYDSRGNLTALVDSTGEAGRPVRTTTWLYQDPDDPDSPSKVVDGKGRQTIYTYGSYGLLQSVQDSRGHITSITYTSAPEPLGLVKTFNEKSVQTWRELASAGDTTDSLMNHVTGFTYDARGNVKTATTPDGLVSAFVSDSIGRALRVYTPTGTLTERVYDKLNRITQFERITSPQAMPYGLSLASMACDTTQVLCADSSRAYSPTLPFALRTYYHYGLAGLDSVVDPRGVVQGYRYNANGEVRETRDEKNVATTAYINAMGTADSVRLRTGFMIKYQYDVLGRLVARTMPGRDYGVAAGDDCNAACVAEFNLPAETITYQYDVGGNLTKVHGNEGEIRRSYFKDGSLKGQFNTSGGLNDSLSVAYDSSGARTVLRHYGPSRVDSVQYVYDAGGAVSQYKLYWPGTGIPNRIITVDRDALGRRRKIVYPGSLQVLYRYDMAGNLRRLWSHHDSLGMANFQLRNRAYDATGNLLSQELTCSSSSLVKTDPCGPATSVETETRYNRLGWVVRQHLGGAELDSLGYDASGNLLFKARHEYDVYGPVEVRQFMYGGHSNRLEVEDRNTPGSLVYYYYQADGSRLIEQPQPQDNSLRERWYYYDALGRTTGLGQYLPTFLWHPQACRYDADGQMYKPCGMGAPTLGFDGASIVTAWGNARWHFVQGEGLDNPLSAVGTWAGQPSQELFYVTDDAGRVLATMDSTGKQPAVITDQSGWAGWEYHGAASRTQGFTANRLASDSAPDVAFFRNRLYDQATGRWTQEDPLGVAGGINLYQFNGNNPVTFTDPFGLCPICFGLAAVGDEILILGAATILAAATTHIANQASKQDLVPTTGHRPTPEERKKVNEIGEASGCMTCGATTPGTASGNWVPNHVPPTSVALPNEPQNLGPHCIDCSRKQGGWLRQLLRKAVKTITGGGDGPAALPAAGVQVEDNPPPA